MAGIPKGFGMVFDSTKVGPSKIVKTFPPKKTDKSKPVEKLVKDPKKKDAKMAVEEEALDAPLKRQKVSSSSSSLLASELSSPAASSITDEDVKRWKAMSSEEESQTLIHASAQMLIASFVRAQRLEKEGARLRKSEAENSKLSKQIKDMERSHQKVCDQHDAEKILKKEVGDYVDISEHLSMTIDNLNKEVSQLKARREELVEDQHNGWKEEKTKLENEQFAKDFRFYATGFLANDPDYDFTKFGEETVQWIEKFKVDEVSAIKARRIELGLEVAEPVLQGAPEAEDVEDTLIASPTQTPPADVDEATPLQVDASGVVHSATNLVQDKGAPTDGVVPKVKTFL